MPNLVQPFTEKGSDPGPAFRGLLAAGMGNSLLEAVAFSAALFPQSTEPRRRILLVFGEPRDRDSKAPFEDVRGILLREGIELYLMAYSTYLQPFLTRPVFECPKAGCAEEDKKRVMPEAGRGLDEALAKISAAIRQGYLLSFSPAAIEGERAGLHTVSISIRRPGVFTVIHRKQYYFE